MSTKTIYVFIFLLCFKLQSISQNSPQTYSIINDSIIPKLKSCNNVATSNIINEYYNYWGITFSKYYIILDSIKIDIDKDGADDRFLVISPITQIYSPDTLNCDHQTGKKLAIILLANKGKYKINYVNENIILNDYEYQSEPYCGIKPNRHGFAICFFIGSIIKCKYWFSFRIKNGDIYLIKRKYDCYVTDLSNNAKQIKNYKLTEDNNLEKINIRNFIEIPDLLNNRK